MAKRGKRSQAGQLRQNVRAMQHLQRMTFVDVDDYAGTLSGRLESTPPNAVRKAFKADTQGQALRTGAHAKSGPVDHRVRETHMGQRSLVPYEESDLHRRRNFKAGIPMTAEERYKRDGWHGKQA